jgi:Ser/Thr protein kinase RdoA (MazF antagonist)
MFKADWEKTSLTAQIPQGLVEKMALLAYPNKKLISHELIAGGCANLNFKIIFQRDKSPLILRVYLRDKDAAYREQKIARLLKQSVPVPQTYYIGKMDGYTFAITEFMPGIPLRALLLGNMAYNLSAIMHNVGQTLSKISLHSFPQAGFFDKKLNILPHQPSDDYLTFAKSCLANKMVSSLLSPDKITKINQILDKHSQHFPNINEKQLVHADFDPANLLVNHIDGIWKVSAVLDWEFAFSGSRLFDLANMLRYAHKMPPDYQNGFLSGLTNNSQKLPENWQITLNLLNLESLLDCLKNADPQSKPNQYADILDLIDHIIIYLN